ncbi:MAG: HDIG domain-containing protein [Desulfomicrobium sp.]|jgi:putative nucleotidyltransferase with HDIG domain|nr:HDIG domain-containing protein [Desulfomicrobium sp.]NLV97377.1 HDIG domain-containing protein [Desulfovibrionales bacterium]
MIERLEALALLQDRVAGHLVVHALETEAVMRKLADHLGQDMQLWGLTGLLHDLDYQDTKDTPTQHGLLSAQLLAGKLPPEALLAIQRHNEINGNQPETVFDHALRCGETVTGLIHAAALVRPEGMHGMNPKSLKKKMKDKSFAASVCRETIKECEHIGLDLTAFLTLAIEAITAIEAEVGLAVESA